MAKRSSKKAASLFDNTEPNDVQNDIQNDVQNDVQKDVKDVQKDVDYISMWQNLKVMLAETDETRVHETQDTVCENTETLLTYVKNSFKPCIERLSASMAQDSEMTQEMAVQTIFSLVGEKSGYDKLEIQLYICAYTPLLIKVNGYMHQGFQCFLAIAKACYEMKVPSLPASVRTLFNACIVYQQKGDDSMMHWVFWTPKCRTRNAVATHSIAQGCFIRSNGMEHLFTPSMTRVEIETREKPNTKGEMAKRPVIDYQWEAKSQRILAFWKNVNIAETKWQAALEQYDTQAHEHIVTYKASLEEKAAKASTKGALKGLETTKKAPNAVKIRNAKLKQLFEDMDF